MKASRIVAGAAAVAAVYAVVSYRIASKVTTAERLPLEDSPDDYGVSFEPVRFMSRRGDVMLDGWYLPGLTEMPTVVITHGVSSTRTGCGMTELAAMLNRRGFGALLFDLRGHGLSGGRQMSGGWFERLDVLGAVDYLRSRGVPSSRIGLMGASMGAAAASLAAVEAPEVRALALDGTYARVADIINREAAISTKLPVWLVQVFRPGAEFLAQKLFGIDVGALTPEDAVRQLGYPVLVIHAGNDERIPVDHGRRVHAAACPGSQYWEIVDACHAETFIGQKEEYEERVARYFISRLGCL